MGQYHMVVNLDKRQFLMPHKLGDGLKLWEQLASGPGGTASALIALLAVSNGRGGGDLNPSELVGSWGGDRIAIVGDYAEATDLPPEFEADKIWDACHEHGGGCEIPAAQHYRDISLDVSALLARELHITYSGTGWRERKDFDRGNVNAMKPDIVIGG